MRRCGDLKIKFVAKQILNISTIFRYLFFNHLVSWVLTGQKFSFCPSAILGNVQGHSRNMPHLEGSLSNMYLPNRVETIRIKSH